MIFSNPELKCYCPAAASAIIFNVTGRNAVRIKRLSTSFALTAAEFWPFCSSSLPFHAVFYVTFKHFGDFNSLN